MDIDELHDEVGDDEDRWLRYWDPGRWLTHRVTTVEQADCEWLETLAAFDTEEGWADAGLFNCAEWLMAGAGMARATAYERLRVSHQLVARAHLRDAYRQGEMSYSALRACCRVDAPDPAVDEAFVAVARAGSVVDVEKAVRTYRLHHDQEHPPPAPTSGRRIRAIPWTDGITKVEEFVTDLEAAELFATIDAHLDRDDPERQPAGAPVDESASADNASPASAAGRPDDATASAPAVDESASADCPDPAGADDAEPRLPLPTRRVDAFLDLVRAAHANATGSSGAGSDLYMVHLVARDGQVTFPDGTPIHPDLAATVCCDATTVVHTVGDGGEPLELGRRSRTWNTAQRRAVLVRDGGTCRFPGCQRHRVDVHHQLPWEDGGHTDVDNAVSLCPRHHTLVHTSFRISGDPNGELRFYDRFLTPVGTSTPAQSRLLDLREST